MLFDQEVGAGLSDSSAYDPKKHASLNGYAQDVLAICRELKLANATLVGHSVGTMVGMLAAVEEPARFQQLLLRCPSPCHLNQADYYGGFERVDVEAMLTLYGEGLRWLG